MTRAQRRLHNFRTAARRSLHRYREVLTERNLAPLLGAAFLSEIGDWFNTVALIALSYRLGDGALGVGVMLAIRMVPRLVFQGPAGTFVDQHSGRSLLVATQLLLAAVATSFALLIAIPSLWLLYGLVLLLEAVTTVARPAFMVRLKVEVVPSHRAAANGVLAVVMTSAQFVGPLLGGLVLAWLGAAWVFIANGLSFLSVAIAVSRLRRLSSAGRGVETDQKSPTFEDHKVGADHATREAPLGYRWLLRQSELSLYGMLSLSIALLIQGTITLFVVRAHALGLGDAGVGVFYAAVAIGSILGSAVAGAGSHTKASSLYRVAAAAAACAVAMVTFGLAGGLGVALMALLVAGFGTDFHEVAALTLFQSRLPDAVYGRFFSLFLMALSAGGLVGALVGPLLERVMGLNTAVIMLAIPSVVVAVLLATVVTKGSGLRSADPR